MNAFALLALFWATTPLVLGSPPCNQALVPYDLDASFLEVADLKNTDPHTLALSLVTRLRLREVRKKLMPATARATIQPSLSPTLTRKSLQLNFHAELQHYFTSETLQAHLRHGFLTTFHQIPFSPQARESHHYLWKRHLTEQRLLNLMLPQEPDAQKQLNNLRPIYAYVTDPTVTEQTMPRQGNTPTFPSPRIIVVSFKPDVLYRATWVVGDSWDQYPQLPHGVTFYSERRPMNFNNHHNPYTEAQIWGPVTMNDVQEFLVSHDIDPRVLKILQKTGRPISEAVQIQGPYGLQYVRTRRP